MPTPPEQACWFDRHVRPHEPELRAFLRRRFPSLTDIDDLVQETYLRLIRAHAAGEIVEPRAYLFSTARNTAFDFFRRQRPVALAELGRNESQDVVDDSANVVETLAQDQQVALLADAVRSLPPRCRDVFILRKYHGLSYREIAQRLGLSEKTVNAHLETGLVRCRQYLAAHGVHRLKD
jgi:RNA polymerase sigma-70 factor (ECF subfamily)